jgi:hypothetical protein
MQLILSWQALILAECEPSHSQGHLHMQCWSDGMNLGEILAFL